MKYAAWQLDLWTRGLRLLHSPEPDWRHLARHFWLARIR